MLEKGRDKFRFAYSNDRILIEYLLCPRNFVCDKEYKLWTKRSPCFMSLYFIEGRQPPMFFSSQRFYDSSIPNNASLIWQKNYNGDFDQGLGTLSECKQLHITRTGSTPTIHSCFGSWKWNLREASSRSLLSKVQLVLGVACLWEERED